MKKKIIALFLALITVVTFSSSVFAETRKEKNDFVSGETYSLSFSEFSVNLLSSKKFEFMLPFFSDKVTIKTTTTGKTIKFKIDGVTHTITLNNDTTEF